MTGYQQRRKQADWLRAGGWPFVIGGDGHPRVLRHHERESQFDAAR